MINYNTDSDLFCALDSTFLANLNVLHSIRFLRFICHEFFFCKTFRSARQSPTSHQPFIGELQHQNSDLQRELGNLKKELELTNQKLGSSMHSIKTFWSPELKKERALRKEESAKYSLINDQLKLLSSENQVRDYWYVFKENILWIRCSYWIFFLNANFELNSYTELFQLCCNV